MQLIRKKLWRYLMPLKPVTVRVDHLSTTGEMHTTDQVPNQDTAFRLLKPDLAAYESRSDSSGECTAPGIYAAAVFDGHGPRGEDASNLAAERMSYAIHRLCEDDSEMPLELVASTAFREAAEALSWAACGLENGTTASLVLIRGTDMVIGNVGDSTIMLVSKKKFGRRHVKYISPAHRPTEESEAERIREAGGFILQGYVVDAQCKNGIAVSRTLGDRDMRKYGCISEPEIRRFQLSKDDKVCILASDGFWDHPGVSVPDVAKRAMRHRRNTAKGLCEELLALARRRGKPQDDCTIACITLQ